MFDCQNCGNKEARRLIAAGSGLKCDGCFDSKPVHNLGVLHAVKFHKWGNRMTIADAMRIKTNKKRADGKYRPDPRWQTSGDKQ